MTLHNVEKKVCPVHQELHQELYPNAFMCESCFVEAFHTDQEGLERDVEREIAKEYLDHDCKSGCACGLGFDDE